MIDGLRPYSDYKESGLPWAGRIPSHWSQRRVKILFSERVQKGFPDEPLLAATQSKGVVRKADYGTRTVTAQKDFHLLKLVEAGDFVISLRSFEGGIEISHCRGIISPAYTVLKPRAEARHRFFVHFFKSPDFIRSLTLFVTGIREGQNIDYARLARAYLPLPPSGEQDQIGRFLDHANGRIERAIRAKKKLIALLNEQKQAIIHRAVTRGLDPHVRLKPSGIPWLGEIPVHWTVKRAKYIFFEVDERSATGEEELLSVSHITGVTPRSEKNITMFKASSYVGHKTCQPGDLVVNTMWAWMGALGVSEHTGIISPAYAVYRPRFSDNFADGYIDGLLRTRPYISNIICRSTGVRASRLRLYPEEFFKLPILLPSPIEQRSIVTWIGKETAHVSEAISQAEREIFLLREYRNRLTADVVTGKLDVRAAARDLPADAKADLPAVSTVEPEIAEDAGEDLDLVSSPA